MHSSNTVLNAFIGCQFKAADSLIDITAKQLNAVANVHSPNDLPALYSKQWQLAGALQSAALDYTLTLSRLSLDLQGGLIRRGNRYADEQKNLSKNILSAADKAVEDVTHVAANVAEEAKNGAEELSSVTKDALYDIAKDTAIEGRSTMNKNQLREAIGEADMAPLEDLTRDELYQKAQLLDIEGRSKMGRDQLLEAIHKTLGR